MKLIKLFGDERVPPISGHREVAPLNRAGREPCGNEGCSATRETGDTVLWVEGTPNELHALWVCSYHCAEMRHRLWN